MDFDKKTFWRIALAFSGALFALTLFFLVAQLPRHHVFVIPPQQVQTNIGAGLLCIGSAFILYYILNREDFFVFFQRREAAIRAMAMDPEKNRAFQDWQKRRNTDLAIKVLLTGGPCILIIMYILQVWYAIIILAALLVVGFLIIRSRG